MKTKYSAIETARRCRRIFPCVDSRVAFEIFKLVRDFNAGKIDLHERIVLREKPLEFCSLDHFFTIFDIELIVTPEPGTIDYLLEGILETVRKEFEP